MSALAAVLLTCLSAGDESGETPASAIPDTTLQEARLGEYWYGAPITDLKELLGKVVLWETWGS